ncbi:unnamed protein product [Ectocarpus sp. 4 AP-2014]
MQLLHDGAVFVVNFSLTFRPYSPPVTLPLLLSLDGNSDSLARWRLRRPELNRLWAMVWGIRFGDVCLRVLVVTLQQCVACFLLLVSFGLVGLTFMYLYILPNIYLFFLDLVEASKFY